jgi:hypothetical protein
MIQRQKCWQGHKITHQSDFYWQEYNNISPTKLYKILTIERDFPNSTHPSVRTLFEMTTTIICLYKNLSKILENSARNETDLQLHMQDILPISYTDLSFEYVHHSQKVSLFIAWLQG